MRVCDIDGCRKPAREIAVEVSVATPHEDDFGTSSINATVYQADLCTVHLEALHAAVAVFERPVRRAQEGSSNA